MSFQADAPTIASPLLTVEDGGLQSKINLLNRGAIESISLQEVGQVDFKQLILNAIPELEEDLARFTLPESIPLKMQKTGRWVLLQMGLQSFFRLAEHPSDIVRGWTGYMVADIPDWTIADRLQLLRRLAVDDHPLVREWCWHALRPLVIAHPEEAVLALKPWVADDNECLRRFAVEVTRPRGAWGPHLKAFKTDPELAVSLLDPVKDDASVYVQMSVSKWLLDVVPSRPDWALQLARRWQYESGCYATRSILKTGLRDLI